MEKHKIYRFNLNVKKIRFNVFDYDSLETIDKLILTVGEIIELIETLKLTGIISISNGWMTYPESLLNGIEFFSLHIDLKKNISLSSEAYYFEDLFWLMIDLGTTKQYFSFSEEGGVYENIPKSIKDKYFKSYNEKLKKYL